MANTATLQITSQILSNGPISQQLKFTVTFVRNGDSFYGSSIPLQIKCGTQQKTINVNIAQQSQVQILTTAIFTVPKTQGNTSLTVMASIARTALPSRECSSPRTLRRISPRLRACRPFR